MSRKRILIVMAAGSGVRMGLPYRNSFWIWVGSLSFEGPSKRSSRRFRTSRWSPFFRRIIFLSGRNIACLRDSIVLRHWFPEASHASIP